MNIKLKYLNNSNYWILCDEYLNKLVTQQFVDETSSVSLVNRELSVDFVCPLGGSSKWRFHAA